ncbi:hypothetical protein chiPu_0012372 [Chiloscyllium punctatum]|uniref:Uncharacterized protein n=1 Tax=Chiloscyllium punctatum TaxID=137246 RepID=A0A401SU30_CHIPU|nr:hypothetical protein [Chiloscyllium punctatum]
MRGVSHRHHHLGAVVPAAGAWTTTPMRLRPLPTAISAHWLRRSRREIQSVNQRVVATAPVPAPPAANSLPLWDYSLITSPPQQVIVVSSQYLGGMVAQWLALLPH